MHTATAKKGTRRVNSAEAFFGCSLSLHPTRKHATRKTYKKIKKEGTATMMEWINVTDSFTEFIRTFCEKHEVKMPNDILFNFPDF